MRHNWRDNPRIGIATLLLALCLMLLDRSARAQAPCDFDSAVSASVFIEDTWQEYTVPITNVEQAWLNTIGEFTIRYRADAPERFDIPGDLRYVHVTLTMPDDTQRYIWLGSNGGPYVYVWAANSLDYMPNYHLRDTCAQQIVDAADIVRAWAVYCFWF